MSHALVQIIIKKAQQNRGERELGYPVFDCYYPFRLQSQAPCLAGSKSGHKSVIALRRCFLGMDINILPYALTISHSKQPKQHLTRAKTELSEAPVLHTCD